VQQLIFQKGQKKIGQNGNQAALKEFDQLRHHDCFTPINVSKLVRIEKKKA